MQTPPPADAAEFDGPSPPRGIAIIVESHMPPLELQAADPDRPGEPRGMSVPEFRHHVDAAMVERAKMIALLPGACPHELSLEQRCEDAMHAARTMTADEYRAYCRAEQVKDEQRWARHMREQNWARQMREPDTSLEQRIAVARRCAEAMTEDGWQALAVANCAVARPARYMHADSGGRDATSITVHTTDAPPAGVPCARIGWDRMYDPDPDRDTDSD